MTAKRPVKTKTSTKTTTKSKQVVNKTVEKKAPVKKKTTNEKPKFDHNDFIFKTKIKYVLDWMKYMQDELDDVNTEWLDGETYDLYAVWLRDIDLYLNNNIPWTLLSSRERYLMGIYRPDTKTSIDDHDKP